MALMHLPGAGRMKLVVDNSNVETIPVGNLMDIAGMARRFADDIDAGKHGEVLQVTVIIETIDNLSRESWGEIPTGYELMGMLETVKMAVLADINSDEYE